jgi:ATP-dependent RNA helicase RhlE
VLVFTKTKHGANRLASQLQKDHINADAIHGNKSQNARIRALEDFKAGKVKVLVATDIAARGLDIEDLPHVVNFDLPHVAEDYVHRIGRTGRAGATGQALSLVAAEDRPLLGAIERLINKKIEVRHVEGFEAGRPGARSEPERPASRSDSTPRHQAKAPRSGAPRQGERNADKSGAPRQGERNADKSGAPRQGERDGERKRREPRTRDRGEDRSPRINTSTSAPPRSSGNSGGMDFNKPYEPSPAAQAAEPAPDSQAHRRKSTQPIPALFRKKAA